MSRHRRRETSQSAHHSRGVKKRPPAVSRVKHWATPCASRPPLAEKISSTRSDGYCLPRRPIRGRQEPSECPRTRIVQKAHIHKSGNRQRWLGPIDRKRQG